MCIYIYIYQYTNIERCTSNVNKKGPQTNNIYFYRTLKQNFKETGKIQKLDKLDKQENMRTG